MKRFLIITLVAMFTMSLFAGPKIKFEKTDLDFGVLDAGKTAELVFKFENIGDATLIIKNVSTSCGCTAPKLEKKEFQPGEKGTLPVIFYSKGYNGKVVKSVTISTNDKENVYTRLKISGKVNLKDFAAFDLSSDKIDFKEVTMGKEYTETFKLKNTGSIELRIIEVTHSPDIYPIFSKKAAKPNEEIEVKMVFNPMQAGRFATFMKIRSNAYRQRMQIVKVSASVKE
jgi:Protein of unknown function (DUF1573)